MTKYVLLHQLVRKVAMFNSVLGPILSITLSYICTYMQRIICENINLFTSTVGRGMVQKLQFILM